MKMYKKPLLYPLKIHSQVTTIGVYSIEVENYKKNSAKYIRKLSLSISIRCVFAKRTNISVFFVFFHREETKAHKMKVATVSASLLLITFLLTFSSGNGQTFQYSRGWTNGKRSNPFLAYAKHTETPWNLSDDIATSYRLLLFDLTLVFFFSFAWKLFSFVSFVGRKTMGTITSIGPITIVTVRFSCLRLRFDTEHNNYASFNCIAFLSTTTN